MRYLTARLEDGYCSITVANHQLITIIRFVAKNYTHLWKDFANRLHLAYHPCEILFVALDSAGNQTTCTHVEVARTEPGQTWPGSTHFSQWILAHSDWIIVEKDKARSRYLSKDPECTHLCIWTAYIHSSLLRFCFCQFLLCYSAREGTAWSHKKGNTRISRKNSQKHHPKIMLLLDVKQVRSSTCMQIITFVLLWLVVGFLDPNYEEDSLVSSYM